MFKSFTDSRVAVVASKAALSTFSVFCVAYLSYFLPPEMASPTLPVIWFVSGIGFLTLILAGLRYWPTITVGWYCALMLHHGGMTLVGGSRLLLISIMVGLTCFAAVYWLEQNKFDKRLSNPRDVILLSVASAVSAFIAVVCTAITSQPPLTTATSWFLAHMAGVILIVPLCSAWFLQEKINFGVRAYAIKFSVWAVTFVSCLFVFDFIPNEYTYSWHLLPILILSALFLNARGFTMTLQIIFLTAYVSTVGKEPLEVFLVQQYIVIIGFTMLILASLVNSRRYSSVLKDNEARYRAIVETAVDGIIVMNSQGIIQSFNASADQMFGYSTIDGVSEMVGKHVTVLMFPSDAKSHQNTISEYERTGTRKILGTKGVTVCARHKDGSGFYAHLAIAEWYIGEQRFYTGTMRDLTKQRESEAARDLLAREVDHRAKNVLSVVQSLVRLTKADTIEQYKSAMGGRIDAMGRAHSALSKENWSGAELVQVIAEELSTVRLDQLELRGPPIRIEPNAVQPVSLILHELLTNAIKYGSLSVTEGIVHVTWRVVSNELQIKWEERGGPTVKKTERIGFGATLLKNVVERQLSGKLEMLWDPEGLSVLINLPGKNFTLSHRETHSQPKLERGEKILQPARIMIVEDSVLVGMETEETLRSNNYFVVGHAVCVDEALKILREEHVDMALVDVDLGHEKSFPVAEELRNRGIPFVFTTGFQSLIEEGWQNHPILRKPVNERTLLEAVADTLAGR